MSNIERAIAKIRAVHAEIGTAAFARLSGVSYTTLRDCEARGFVGPSIETLQKLEAAAEVHVAATPSDSPKAA